MPDHEDSLTARVSALEDRLAIADLYAYYAWLFDNDIMGNRVADEIFTEDVELVGGSAARSASGREAVRTLFVGLGAFVEATATYFTNVRIDLRGDATASAQAYFQSYHWSAETADGSSMRPVDFVGAGVYLDELRKENGRWWIFHRTRRNLGPGPLAFGALPTHHREAMSGWGEEHGE